MGEEMKSGISSMMWPYGLLFFVAMGVMYGCSTPEARPTSSGESSEEIRVSFVSPEELAAFHREVAGQYRQMDLHYQVFDQVARGEGPELTGHEEHRLHRKLYRRHRTLARHHEERTRIFRDSPSLAEEERRLARLHREAYRWHRARFSGDGVGLVPSTPELVSLRQELSFLRALIALTLDPGYNEAEAQREERELIPSLEYEESDGAEGQSQLL